MDIYLFVNNNCNMNLEYIGFHIKQIFLCKGHERQCFMFEPALHTNAILGLSLHLLWETFWTTVRLLIALAFH